MKTKRTPRKRFRVCKATPCCNQHVLIWDTRLTRFQCKCGRTAK